MNKLNTRKNSEGESGLVSWQRETIAGATIDQVETQRRTNGSGKQSNSRSCRHCRRFDTDLPRLYLEFGLNRHMEHEALIHHGASP